MSYDNDDERNAREQYQEMADEENVVIASLFYPFNRVRFPTVALSIVARAEHEGFLSKLQRSSVWMYRTLPRLAAKDVQDLESWIMGA